MLAVITVSRVTKMATNAELMYQRPRSVAENTAPYAENVSLGMAQVAGMMIVAFSDLNEVSRVQAIGISQTSASAMTTPVTARPNRLARQSLAALGADWAALSGLACADRCHGVLIATVTLPFP